MPLPIRPLALALLLVGLAPLAAPAHEPGLSHATLRQEASRLVLSLRFDAEDWERLSRAGLSQGAVRIRAGEHGLTPLAPARVERRGDHVDVTLRYPRPDAGPLRFAFAGFRALRLGHRQYVELRDARGARLADALLKESAPAAWLARVL